MFSPLFGIDVPFNMNQEFLIDAMTLFPTQEQDNNFENIMSENENILNEQEEEQFLDPSFAENQGNDLGNPAFVPLIQEGDAAFVAPMQGPPAIVIDLAEFFSSPSWVSFAVSMNIIRESTSPNFFSFIIQPIMATSVVSVGVVKMAIGHVKQFKTILKE